MKRTLLKILILILTMAVALGISVAQEGGSLVLTYEIPPEASAAEVTFSPAGIVETEETACNSATGQCTVRLRALAQGETVLNLHWDKVDDTGFYAQDMENALTVLPGKVILDRVTLNFSGWINLAVVLEVFLFALAGLLFYEYIQEKKNAGLYSYRRIRLLGFTMFFLVLALLRVSSVIRLIGNNNSGTVWSLLVSLFFAAREFMAVTAPAVIVFAAGLSISNIVLLIREGVYLTNFLGLAVGFVMAGGALLGMSMHYNWTGYMLSNEVLNVFAGIFVYFECHFFATINCALQAALHVPDYDKDYVLILGCRVRPDGTLYPLIRSRVDRAADFAEEQKKRTGKAPVLVPSGGKGSDEHCSEADAMANYLRNRGVPEEGILVENRSTTTRENMLFSRSLIDNGKNREKNSNKESIRESVTGNVTGSATGSVTGSSDEIKPEESKVAFSTSNYHVFRGGILAEQTGWKIDGMGSRTKWYYWPNAFLREFFGLMVSSWPSQVITLTLICAVCLALMRLL